MATAAASLRCSSSSVIRCFTPIATAQPVVMHADHYTQRRFFWNPFSSSTENGSLPHKGKKSSARAMNAAATKLAEAQIQQHEALIEASLAILKATTAKASSSTSPQASECSDQSKNAACLSDESNEALVAVAHSLFVDQTLKPSQQFELVFYALRLPDVRERRDLRGHLYVVLSSILPEKLYAVFEEAGDDLVALPSSSKNEEQAATDPVFLFRRFVYFLLGDVSLFPDNVDQIDVDAILIELEDAIPSLNNCQSFESLKLSADKMILTARLYALIGELCADMDAEKTGKISLDEFSQCLERVVGQEEAKVMLATIKPDADGKIRYHHVSSLLTKPTTN